MAQSLGLSSTISVFPCPHCHQIINTSMQQCSFCLTVIDRDAAATAAAATTKVSQACSDASYLKIMLAALIPFGLTIFFPFLGLVGLVGFLFLKYAVPVMAVRWWIKFGKIKTNDGDFRKARTTTIWVSASSLAILLFLRVYLFGLHL